MRHRRVTLTRLWCVMWTVVLLLNAGVVEAQSARAAEDSPRAGFGDVPVFLPRSYLYWGSPVGPKGARENLYFALEYAFHLPVYNDLRAKVERGAAWAGAATFSFAGALRMLNEVSEPVRMPSYRPSATGQVFRVFYGAFPVLLGLKLEIAHHSNGQEGCVFDEDLRDRTDACQLAIAEVTDPSAELNRMSGNFSNSLVGLGLDVRAHLVDDEGLAIGHLAGGLMLDVNLPARLGGLTEGVRRLYGTGDLTAHVELQRMLGCSELRAAADVRHFFRTGLQVPSTSGALTLSAQPYRLVGFGFFVRYYGGRDFYNAFFVDRIQQFAMGVFWDGLRPLRFPVP